MINTSAEKLPARINECFHAHKNSYLLCEFSRLRSGFFFANIWVD